MIDWRSYFSNVSNRSAHAKDAEALAIEDSARGKSYAKAAKVDNQVREELPGFEDVLKGRAIELWTVGGRLFLVADEQDMKMAVERLGARRGEVYTAREARRIIALNDPSVVAEIQEWKRQFDGVVH